MGGRTAILALLGFLNLLAAEIAAAPRDAWSEAVAYYQQRGGSKKAEERATAASRLVDGMDGKHDKLATGFLLSLLTTELNREEGGKKEEQVSGDVLHNCEDSLRRASMAEAVDIIIREARKNKSPRARFHLARVLGGVKGDAASRSLIDLSEDKDPHVVIGAADGLKVRADESTIEAILKIARRKDCPWEATIACFDALEKINKPDKCVDGLLEILEAMKPDAGRMKARLVETLGKLCSIPEPRSDEAGWWKEAWAAKKAGKEADKPDAAPAVAPTEFYGLKSMSTRFVFLVDISSAVDTPFTKPAAPKKAPDPKKPDDSKKGAGGAKKGDTPDDAAKAKAAEIRRKYDDRIVKKKFDDLKRELVDTIYALDPHVSFTVVWFDGEPKAWKEELVPATWQNKLACLLEADKISPNGAAGTNI